MNTLDIDNITKSAIDRLNKIRTDKRISIAEIARKMGKAESSVKRVLSGDSKNSSVAMLLGIGIALEVEVSDIFKDSEIVAVVNAKENEADTAVVVAETAKRIALAGGQVNTLKCDNCQLLAFYKKELEAREAWINKLIEMSYNHSCKRKKYN